MKPIYALILTILPLVLADSLWISPAAQAQMTGIDWEEPVNLSNTLTSSTRPAIIVDRLGQLHVFWSEDLDGEAVRPNQTPNVGNAIIYRRWTNGAWSQAIDIVYTDQGRYHEPSVVIDSKGTIHLVWIGLAGVYYSHAQLDAPVSAASWASPQTIAFVPQPDQAEMAIDDVDNLYLVYTSYADANANLIKSFDGGNNWSASTVVSILLHGEAKFAFLPRLVIDSDNRMHLAWIGYSGSPDFRGYELFYRYSDDGGETWSVPFNLADHISPPSEDVSGVVIASVNPQTIIAVYIAGQLTYRYYRVSYDGGDTWSGPRRLFGELHSRAGWDAIAVDGDGRTHLLTQLRYPEGFYTSTWQSGDWTEPPDLVLGAPPLNVAHYPQAVISEGNQLHVVMEEHPAGEIWYMYGQILNTARVQDLEPYSSLPIEQTIVASPPEIVLPGSDDLTPIVPTISFQSSPEPPQLPRVGEGLLAAFCVTGVFIFGLIFFLRGNKLH